MSQQRIFWDYEEHLGTILAKRDDPLGKLGATEHMVRDRLSWLHFCGLKPHDTVPDANTLWDFREALIKAGVLDELFEEMNRIIAEAGFISRSGQVVDSSLVAAPRKRATGEEKAAIKEGRPAGEI